MTTSAALLPAALRPRQVLNWFGVAPFFLFATLFLILPTFNIVVGAFRDTQGQLTLENLGKLFSPSIRSAFWISIELSLLTAVLGCLFGFLIAAVITLGDLPRPLRNVVLSGRISEVHFLGSIIRMRVAIADQLVSLDTFNQPDRPPPAVGALVEVSVSDRDLLVLAT